MVYCSKCGTKNEEADEYCSQCGQSLTSKEKNFEKEWEDRCEQECAGGKEGGGVWRIFWGLVVVLIGIWIIFELVLKNLADEVTQLAWVKDLTFPFWWIIGAAIGIIIIVAGIRIIAKK